MAGMVAGVRRRRGGLLYLLLFTSLLTVSLSVLSVAPDDFDSNCTKFAEPGSFNNPNEKVLMDTQFYISGTLLDVQGDDELWIGLDFDMKTGTGNSKVRKHESHPEGNREPVRTCVCVCVVSLCTFAVVG